MYYIYIYIYIYIYYINFCKVSKNILMNRCVFITIFASNTLFMALKLKEIYIYIYLYI